TLGMRALQLSLTREAERESIDEDVAVVRRIEHRLARHRRHADAVPVSADAADDAPEQKPSAWMVERAELERIHARDRRRGHRKDVAENSADAGRGALIRLDVRRMVVALDFEHREPSITHVDSAGVLALADRNQLAARGQRFQMASRGFVRAV